MKHKTKTTDLPCFCWRLSGRRELTWGEDTVHISGLQQAVVKLLSDGFQLLIEAWGHQHVVDFLRTQLLPEGGGERNTSGSILPHWQCSDVLSFALVGIQTVIKVHMKKKRNNLNLMRASAPKLYLLFSEVVFDQAAHNLLRRPGCADMRRDQAAQDTLWVADPS